MRLSGTKATAIHQYRGLGNQLWDLAGNRPSIDLPFAETKSLVDATTGTNLVDFTRASSGTYVGSDGLIKTATTNLLLQSEDLTVSPWTQVGAVVTEDYTQGVPFEGAKVYKIVFSAANQAVSQGISYLAKEYTASIYMKGTQGDIVRFSGKTGQSAVNYTLSGSWERLTQTFTTITDTANFNINTAGLSAVTVYVAAPQLEQSSTVGEYVKTTSTINSAPRFDHDPTTGESLGLLVEESRTNEVRQSQAFDTVAPPDQAWLPVGDGVTVTPNQTVAPDGTVTADLLTANAGANDKGIQDFIAASVAGTTYTVSVFAKAASSSSVRIHYEGGGETAAFAVNLATGTQILAANTTDVSITPYLDGWYRISVTKTAVGSAGMAARVLLCNSDGTTPGATGSVYVWGAQFETGAFPTSYIPTEGSTVTRAADVASISGNNFGTFNLLAYSEEFDNASWVKLDSSVTPSAGLAPDGTFSATKLTEDSTLNNHYIQSSSASFISNTAYVFSVFLKKGERQYARLRLTTATGPRAWFDLEGGTIMGTDPGVSATISDAGNGWYRCALIMPNIGTPTVLAGQVFTQSSSGTQTIYQGDGTSGIYIWGAQLEQSDVATPYVKSNVTFTSRASSATYYDKDGVIQTAAVDEARTAAYLPDGNGNFVSAGPLLLEGAGTNLIKYSESITSWSNTSGGTAVVTVNAAADPAGGNTATLIENNGTASHVGDITNWSLNTTYTISGYLKAGTGDKVAMLLYSSGVASGFWNNETSNVAITFNLTSGTTEPSPNAVAPTSSSITDAGNGWYRCSITATCTAAHTSGHQFIRNMSGATDGIYAWGFQIEEGSFPTSYIPTAGSAVTRAADVSDGGANTFGNSWYRQDEGTMFTDTCRANPMPVGSFGQVFYMYDGTGNNTLNIGYLTIGASQFRVRRNGSNEANILPNTSSLRRVTAGAYASGAAASESGATAVVVGSVTLPTGLSQVQIGNDHAGSTPLNGTIRRLTYWQTRLPNSTLSTITQ